MRMLELLAFSGVGAVVFAGGDPTLRKDLPELIAYADALGLSVEVQTNAHFLPALMKEALLGVHTSLIGLSIDGASAQSHDSMRSTRGNFSRVISLLSQCQEAGKPVIVRTVVTRQNREELIGIAELLSQYENIIRWSLMEFTPIGAGYVNSSLFALSDDDYLEASSSARLAYTGHAKVDLFAGSSKMGTYALIKPNGDLYGTSEPSQGAYPTVGNFLMDHLSDLADSLPFSRTRHELRYGARLARELLTPEHPLPEPE
jgi:MoaA/NifB/PqqE/SkfB family radical SAM enzyme